MPDTYWDLFLGYSAIWFVIAALLWHLLKEQRQLKRDLDRLNETRGAEAVEQERMSSSA